MKRKLAAIVAACCLAMQLPVFAGDIVPSGASVYLNGEQLTFDVPPMNQDGRTLVPMRGIFEALGGTVEWDGATQKVTVWQDETDVELTIGSTTAYVDGFAVEMDVPAMVYNDRTLVPLRFVSEKLGLDVQYDGLYNVIRIVGGSVNEDNDTGFGEQVINFEDGTKYIGEVENGQANGYGIVYLANGNKLYEGQMANDKPNGTGKFYNVNGVLFYEGDLKDGLYHGHGTYHFKGGEKYVGDFVNDKMTGEGAWYDENGFCFYQGGILNGKPHGLGHYYYEDGTVRHYKFDNGEIVQELVEIPLNGTQEPGSSGANSYGGSNFGGGSSGTNVNFSMAKYPLHLYADDNSRTYLGKLTTNKYDRDSIANEYGDYGSKYKATIFNQYGDYGSAYSQYSAFNKLASHPPRIVDDNGKLIGYLTANPTIRDGITYEELMQQLKKYHQ